MTGPIRQCAVIATFRQYRRRMAEFQIAEGQLTLAMNPLEHVAALHKDVTVPISEVTGVRVLDRAWVAVNGDRTGTDAPGVLVAGRFKGPHGLTIAVCHGSRPGIEVALEGTNPHYLIATVDDPAAVAHRLRVAAGLPLA